MKLKRENERVLFGGRSGVVIGYTTVTRQNNEEPETYYIVELDAPSAGWLDSPGAPRAYVTLLLVHVDNVD